MASFCFYSQAKTLTVKLSTSQDNMNVMVQDKNFNTIESLTLTKSTWENTFDFDDSNLGNYMFFPGGHVFSAIILGDNQGDDTICCNVESDGFHYCVYNNSFPGYPGCK